MEAGGAKRTDREGGQATVELLGVVPAMLVVVLVGWQLLLAGQASWLAGNAARVAARAAAVGGDADAAARGALPRHLRRGLTVVRRDGEVTVRLRMPIVLRAWHSPLRIRASAGAPQ